MTRKTTHAKIQSKLLAIRLPAGWWEQLEDLARADGYLNTSELIREMLRERMNRSKSKREDGDRHAKEVET